MFACLLKNTSDVVKIVSVYSPLASRILSLCYHRNLPDTVMAFCCRLQSPGSPLSVVSIGYGIINLNYEIRVMLFHTSVV